MTDHGQEYEGVSEGQWRADLAARDSDLRAAQQAQNAAIERARLQWRSGSSKPSRRRKASHDDDAQPHRLDKSMRYGGVPHRDT